MTIEVVVAEDFAGTAAAMFVDAARRAILLRGRFAVALTGGSTPGPIHRALAAAPHVDEVDWAKVHIFFGDERAVPPDAKDSNYRAAREALLDHVPIPKEQVHRMEGERSDLHVAARDYERALVEVCGAELDLMFLGIGKDAHVLSLFPGSPHIDETAALVVASIDPPMNPALSRITMTPVAVARAREVVAIACGPDKREAVQRTLREDDADVHRTPSRLLGRARMARIVLDRAAHG